MRHVLEFPPDPRPWLVIGKGPSFERRHRLGMEAYRTIGLNQVAIREECDVAHFIDYEPWIVSGPYIELESVWMPYEPHWRERGGHGSVRVFAQHDEELRCTIAQDKLYTYDLFGSTEKGWPGKPEIYAYCSTFEATLHILSLLGAKEVFTLGIDGGTERHPLFANDYRREHVSYDYQKPHIEELKEKLGIKVTPL